MSLFHFVRYGYDEDLQEAFFEYRYDEHTFCETMRFEQAGDFYNPEILYRALFLAFLTIGTSYYKAFPVRDVVFEKGHLDAWQADFCNTVYQEGLGQFAYENQLTRDDLAFFTPTSNEPAEPLEYSHAGVLCLQSGGKDSLLLAKMLEQHSTEYTPWYMQQGVSHPAVLDNLGTPLALAHRTIDKSALAKAAESGAKNGHVPVTYIALSYALIQAILIGKNTILSAVGHEGEEPHAHIGDLAVTHQWSKTWRAEQLFATYVERYISADIMVGSPLRSISELEICERFANVAWADYKDIFSSCNVANYQQGSDNTELSWCAECPKCVNAFLLFAPFVERQELLQVFGDDLLADQTLHDTYKGLLGVDDAFKPFECVAEYDELRWAYHRAIERGFSPLPFAVPQPTPDFDPHQKYPSQDFSDIC